MYLWPLDHTFSISVNISGQMQISLSHCHDYCCFLFFADAMCSTDKHTPWLSTRINLESEREYCEYLLVLGFFMFGHLVSVAADSNDDASKFFIGYLRSFC